MERTLRVFDSFAAAHRADLDEWLALSGEVEEDRRRQKTRTG
jgi:hypothetical protein